MTRAILVLHPGAMGVALGRCLTGAGHAVGWVEAGRSAATRRRATDAALRSYATLDAAVASVDIVLSVCPPDVASEVARAVSEVGFRGVYVDANAISPDTAGHVANLVTATGADFVDGGIIGPPPRAAGTTRLYLAGARAADVATCFDETALEAVTLGDSPGAASALKMCYAAWSKGSAALLLNVAALARTSGVEHALRGEWSRSMPGLTDRLADAAETNAPKAWRFVGEMEEIAATFERQGLIGAWHRAAAVTYGALDKFRDAPDGATLDAVLAALIDAGPGRAD